jgi:uncharacterized protein YjiS (DUF1127 family)
MNALFAKNQMSHLAPAGFDHRDATDAGEPRPGIGRKIANALAWVVAMPQRRAVIDELSRLTDRELADIGVARSELKHVFDPAYARERTMRGTSYRSLGLNV